MQQAKISIIVPVYKVEKYLSKCIESILAQTFQDFELILVDDGSPDLCGDICEEYALKDSRIKVLHKENGGLSDARNAGIELAQGEYLAFIDSDDYVAPDMYETLYSLAQEYQAEIAVCNAVLVDETVEPVYKDSSELYVMKSEEALKQMIFNRLFAVNAWNKIYRRELFSGIRYPKGMLYEDFATTYKLIDRCKSIVYTPSQKYAYVQRAGSIMGQTGYKMKADKVIIVSEMIEYLQGKQDFDLLFAGAVASLLNDVYKMAVSGNLTTCKDYTLELKILLQRYKRQFKANKYLMNKDKMILKMAVRHKKLLQFLYTKVRRG